MRIIQSSQTKVLMMITLCTPSVHSYLLKNSFFKDYIQVFKNKLKNDENTSANHIISKAKSKYANMTKSKDWGKNDPKDTQLMALMTKIEKLEGNKNSTGKKGGQNKSSPSTATGANNSCINPERMKKAGPKKMIDGRIQLWCTQHVCPKGRYNGLYCNRDDAGYPE